MFKVNHRSMAVKFIRLTWEEYSQVPSILPLPLFPRLRNNFTLTVYTCPYFPSLTSQVVLPSDRNIPICTHNVITLLTLSIDMTISTLSTVTFIRIFGIDVPPFLFRNLICLDGLRIDTSNFFFRNMTSLRAFTIDTCLSPQYRDFFTYPRYCHVPL